MALEESAEDMAELGDELAEAARWALIGGESKDFVRLERALRAWKELRP